MRELNKQREGHPSPEPQKPISEAGSDPTSDEDEKEEEKDEDEKGKKKDEGEKEKKKEKESSSDGESSSSNEEKKEEFKKTAEELKQEAVMKGRTKDLEKMKEDAEERRGKIAEAAKSLAEKAEETNEETAAGKAEETDKETAAGKAEETDKETAAGKVEETDVDEEKRDQEERRRLKTDFDINTQSLWPVITTDVQEDPQKIRVALPSQELERKFNLLREITLKPVSSLPDGYGLRVRELKERVEGSVIESEESLSILNDDAKKAAKRVSEAQEELKSYVKELERELKEKVQQKQASIKEAETDYQAARANVEAVEVAKMACEHFGSLLTNTDICLGEMKDAFPELQRLYERPDEAVVEQGKTLSEIMAKVKERKRGDSMRAAGTPAQGTPGEKKEEKKPVAKKMPEDIKKKQQMMKDYEEKQELLKKKLEEAKASVESIGRQRPSEPEGEPRKKTAEKISQKESEDDERNLENVDKKWLKRQYSDRVCFWCKQPGHRAEECVLMWQKVRELKAKEPAEMLASRNIFCQWCFWNITGLQGRKDRPYAGWGGHSPDICWHRPEQSQEMKEWIKDKKKKEELVKGSPPNPSWGKEPKRLKVADVKSSGEEEEKKKKKKGDEKKEEKRRKKADQAKGSSRDPPKEEKKKKEKKEKKRRASDSSEIIEAAAKVQKRKDEKIYKDQTSDLE